MKPNLQNLTCHFPKNEPSCVSNRFQSPKCERSDFMLLLLRSGEKGESVSKYRT